MHLSLILQLQSSWVNVSTLTYYQFDLTALGLPLSYHTLSATVRASNIMGTVQATSDGVMVVPLGASTGTVCMILRSSLLLNEVC
jgi:hypothetical protein